MQTQRIKKHGGFWVCRDPDDGYFWRNGPDSFGYFDTVEECISSIDDYNHEETCIARDEGRLPVDALESALPAPWWEAR